MAITQFRLFKICTCLASLLSFFKRLICRWVHLNTSQKSSKVLLKTLTFCQCCIAFLGGQIESRLPLTFYLVTLPCRTGRGRKLSGDQITLPTTVDFSSSVPKQVSMASNLNNCLAEFRPWGFIIGKIHHSYNHLNQRHIIFSSTDKHQFWIHQVWHLMLFSIVVHTAGDWRMELLGWRGSYEY